MIDEVKFLKYMVYDLNHHLKTIEARIKRLKKEGKGSVPRTP
jgi:hypothetical protein